jgi:hypothetical protein
MSKRAFNERGRPIGQGHHLAKLTDEHVDAILDLWDEGLSFAEIARRFVGTLTIHRSHVRRICLGQQRSQLPAKWR